MNLLLLFLLASIVVLGTSTSGEIREFSFPSIPRLLSDEETSGSLLKNPEVTTETSSLDSETFGTTLKSPEITLSPDSETTGTTLKNPGGTVGPSELPKSSGSVIYYSTLLIFMVSFAVLFLFY